MTPADIVAEFEQRTGFSLPEGLSKALQGPAPVQVRNAKLFADPIRLGPIPVDAIHAESRLEDFGYRLQTVNNYHTYCQENCLCIDPLGNGDLIFLVGEGGQFLPALWFADHETTDVHLVVEDVDKAIKGASA